MSPQWEDPVPADVTASPQRAGGFAGAGVRTGSPAAGLTVLLGGAMDDGPRLPLLPAGLADTTK
ncbi:hypothetical protein WR43_22890 [Mycolicibacter arupensis]|uniref:PPE-PPW subfamily C-terminal domain-containing protein n=1 Tax=Mycolicibacter arupensis TaxID=342002 RepID=A0A0M2WBD5_9MYCO|nr:hypothetical protein WR43_22890 [Mycolicibacter arupensis]